MRMDQRYTRVRDMIMAEEVPKFWWGGPALCHRCQREVYFKGGFLKMITADLYWEATYGHWARKKGIIK